ncbi:3'-5' exonuclease, partial [Pseudomonas monteilii]|nr:3'-5' exonuclease [Pseudomonas monteilii]
MKKIRELTVDETFQLFLLIKNADVRIAKNGKKFIAFTFQDTSGTIDGKFWDASDEEIWQALEIAQAKDFVSELADGLDLRLAKPEEPHEPSQYMEKAPLRKEEMEEEISQILFEITNPHWNRIVRFLLNKYKKEFFDFPAAKRNHHAFASGLAYHTTTMLRLGKAIVKEYPELNASLLYAGIILHDLGKVIELTGPMTTEYTLAGNLVGHLVLVDEEITQACIALKFDDKQEDIVVLRHMV